MNSLRLVFSVDELDSVLDEAISLYPIKMLKFAEACAKHVGHLDNDCASFAASSVIKAGLSASQLCRWALRNPSNASETYTNMRKNIRRAVRYARAAISDTSTEEKWQVQEFNACIRPFL